MKIITDRLPYLPVFEGEGAAAGATGAAAGATGAAAGATGAAPGATGDAGATGAAPLNNALAAPADGGKVTVPADWPTDWREKMAGGDAKVVERLKRYDSPVAFGKAGLEAQTRILSGKVAEDVPMPDEKTDAAGAKAWREERGIPVDPTGYKLPDDVTKALSPDDAPVLANFTTYAHANGMTPKQVEQSVKWYAGLVETQRAEEVALDKGAEAATEDALRKTWGEGYRDNKMMAQKFSSEAIPGVDWFMARLPNDPKFGDNAGKTLGNIPGVVEALAGLGLLKYGDVIFADGAAAKATESRMAELKNIMDTDIDKWNASPALRKEYFEGLEKMAKRPGQQG